ncbi:MAG: VOC family protein [Mucilaginibacter sp.]|uniref:VOC family protein n=1 Tax=Mucilaginibacter sp. TaxID=1882438 RepID=UPI0034E506B0
MKKTFFVSAFLAFAAVAAFKFNAAAQEIPVINHITVYVVDLKKSSDFYKNAMLFKEIPEPFHDGRHVWLRMGPHAQLHVVQGAKVITQHDINVHMAFTVPDLKKFTAHLDQMHVKYGNWKGDSKEPQLRPDGVKQIYFQDPDNNWIEVNDDKF